MDEISPVEGGRIISGRDLFPKNYEIRRSPFGSPVIQPRMSGKGSSPWADPTQMKQAHAARQSKQKIEDHRKQQAIRRELHRKELRRQQEWENRRNQEIRQIITQKEGPYVPAKGQSE